MLCQCCHQRPALERNGRAVQLALFESIEGFFCEVCVLALQQPFDDELRAAIGERAPQLSKEDLARLPAQMLKYTLMLPIPHGRPL
jgi:hypothetical protein